MKCLNDAQQSLLKPLLGLGFVLQRLSNEYNECINILVCCHMPARSVQDLKVSYSIAHPPEGESPPGTIGRYDIEVGVMCLKDTDVELGDSHSSVEKCGKHDKFAPKMHRSAA